MALGELDGLPWGTQSLWKALREGRLSLAEGPTAILPSLLPALHVDALMTGEGLEAMWVAYAWQPPQTKRKSSRGVGVAAFARRLIAQERSRVRRSTYPKQMDRRDRRTPRAA